MSVLTVCQNGKTIKVHFTGNHALTQLLEEEGFTASHPCGGRGTCGKCGVIVSGAVSQPNEAECAAGMRLSCQVQVFGDAKVILPNTAAFIQIQLDSGDCHHTHRPIGRKLGAALDVGTTTLALKLYDIQSGTLLAQEGMLNPQCAVAADVMGRIGKAMDEGPERLQLLALDSIKSLLNKACTQVCRLLDDLESLVIAGNTTMLYLLTGRRTHCLAKAPFEADYLFGETQTVLGKDAYLPPCMNAFVGADITCAVMASGMCEKNQIALLCDIGTNGEIALWKGGVLYVSSTAAGPVFEGAGISCGCGSVSGAIDSVCIENGEIKVHTIGDTTAVGICGSGLIDGIAAYLELGEIDETGSTERDVLPLAEGVYLIPGDVRAVQLAKAALAAGIETLLETAGIKADDVCTLYIAGGFGSHLNVKSAADIGLIPRTLADKVKILGNASLAGASGLLLEGNNREEAQRIASSAKHVMLGGNPNFNEHYMDQMLFPEKSAQ